MSKKTEYSTEFDRGPRFRKSIYIMKGKGLQVLVDMSGSGVSGVGPEISVDDFMTGQQLAQLRWAHHPQLLFLGVSGFIIVSLYRYGSLRKTLVS